MRRGLTVLAFTTVVASIGSLTAAASPVVGPKSTPQVAPGVGAAATYKNPPNPICSIGRPTGATDYPIDCEAGVGIHNEEAIAVDPTDPDHWVASANDYQLKVSNGGQVAAYVYSREGHVRRRCHLDDAPGAVQGVHGHGRSLDRVR
jgi:hypothetical protein